MNSVERLFITLANLFPVWVLTGAGLALWKPETATWFQPHWIPYFLGLIMLSMGLTLSLEDFSRVLKMPKSILLGVGLQYTIMPGLGYALALGFNLPIDFVIGLVLVACCPGGTASNVVCFIARTHVALSVSLTTCSTLLAVLLTPFLTTWWVESISLEQTGLKVDVDTLGLLLKTLKVVILPVLLGIFLNHFFHRGVKKVEAYTPFVAVLSIVFIVDFILADKKSAILEIGASLIVAVLLLHLLGFILGYVLSRLLKFTERDAQTVSIEVGMQNSGLATELARSNFPAYGLATVPGAISALTHCILGSIAAGLCRWHNASTRNRDH
ncbi:MAG TPA: bile acid:sodium symporter family protein [Nitrospinaceae bacterium]|nr:sodium:bile acid symporter [Nitrospina sp.]HCK67701.1 sodium:bile acid symporter [Nitrospina sp.]HIE79597.1 bile acid:sodium symporter family protein [Nitrospinaceae bacterium]